MILKLKKMNNYHLLKKIKIIIKIELIQKNVQIFYNFNIAQYLMN
jgi:hypothetical protein